MSGRAIRLASMMPVVAFFPYSAPTCLPHMRRGRYEAKGRFGTRTLQSNWLTESDFEVMEMKHDGLTGVRYSGDRIKCLADEWSQY